MIKCSRNFRKKLSGWTKASKQKLRGKKAYFQLVIVLLVWKILKRPQRHPTMIPAPPEQLVIPGEKQNILDFAHEHGKISNFPVYIFYKARSGQLNNQLISFFNALAIAKKANATLVAPFAFYGSESYRDFGTGRSWFFYIQQWFDVNIYQCILRTFGLYYVHDELLGDYFDAELLNEIQPVTSIMEFRRSEAGAYLRTFPHVLTRRGDAPFFHMTLGRRSVIERNVRIRGEHAGTSTLDISMHTASRKELDCVFNLSSHLQGLPYSAGVNGNYIFLSKLYRSHSLNCTKEYPYWLSLRRNVQPRMEIRNQVTKALKEWGTVMTVHLRLFPFDLGKFTADGFCDYFLSQYARELTKVDHVYIAYSVSSKESVVIISELRQKLGSSKIITADAYGRLVELGPAFNKRYAAPIVDMWTAVHSSYFVGRLGSSLSWNVVYWREAFGRQAAEQNFYRLQQFAIGSQHNPTDSYGF